jgi:glycosyltransferase involved in cell wall biosynthesis
MKVSIVMPSLDQGGFIGPAIASALAQQGGELELIIQDGGSTDETAEVVRSFSDERIAFHTQPDRGQSHALNMAIERATGDWIAWLNADDLLAEGALARVAPLLAGDHEVVFGDFGYIDERGAVTRRIASGPQLDRRRLLAQGNYLFSGTVFLQPSVFAAHGGFDEELHFAMDYDYWLRIAGGVRAVHCPAELAYFRLHGAGNTTARSGKVIRETIRVRRAHGAFSGSTLAPALYHQGKQIADVLSRPVRRRLSRPAMPRLTGR